MSTPKQPTLFGRGLGGELRVLREGRRMSCKRVADLLGWQASKISRMETGKQGIRPADVASLLVVYEVTGRERERFLKQAERADEEAYWERPGLPSDSRVLMRLESEASAIDCYQAILVPGLAQTSEYIRAVMRACNVPEDDIDMRVSARAGRQLIFTKEKPPSLRLIVDEFALRRVIGGPKVMARQLRRVLEMLDAEGTTLHVLPASLQGHGGLDGAYMMLDFPQNKPVVLLDHMVSSLFLEEPRHVEYFRIVTGRLVDRALSPAKSAEFVATLAREFDRE